MKPRPPKLQVGDEAPRFNVSDINGNVINLADYQGQNLLLSFFRYAGCPWCNLAVHRLTLEYPKLREKGLKVVTFMQSSRQNIIKNIEERHVPAPPFPIIADPGRKIYQAYGVEDSMTAAVRSVRALPAWVSAQFKYKYKQANVDGSLFLVPAEFLIGPDLTIQKAHYGRDYNDQIPFIEIYEFLLFQDKHLHPAEQRPANPLP